METGFDLVTRNQALELTGCSWLGFRQQIKNALKYNKSDSDNKRRKKKRKKNQKLETKIHDEQLQQQQQQQMKKYARGN